MFFFHNFAVMNNDRSIQLLQQQRILLEMEYAAEKEAFRKQTETIGIQRKVKRGDAWFPITIGKCFYNSLNQSVVEVFRNADDDTELRATISYCVTTRLYATIYWMPSA